MRRQIAILAAVVLLSLVPGWASAGNKIELTESEMDEVSAAGAFGLELLLLKNPGIKSITYNTSGSNSQITVNGSVKPISNFPPPPATSTLPFAFETHTTVLGSQNGLLNLGLINKTNTSLIQSNGTGSRFYRTPF